MNKKKAIGTLGRLLANSDSRSLERTRNRMLLAMKIEAAMRKKGFTCAQFAKKIGRTENEISAFKIILAAAYQFNMRFGMGTVSQMLAGAKTAVLVERNLVASPFFGA